jgi:hypothetical protein
LQPAAIAVFCWKKFANTIEYKEDIGPQRFHLDHGKYPPDRAQSKMFFTLQPSLQEFAVGVNYAKVNQVKICRI